MPRAGSGDGVHWRCGPSFWDNVIMGGTAGSVVSCRRTFSTTSIMSGRAQPRALRLSGPMTVFSCVLFVPSPLLTFHNLSLFWLLFFVSYQLHYHLQYMPASAYQSLPVHMNHLCPRFFCHIYRCLYMLKEAWHEARLTLSQNPVLFILNVFK